MTTQDLDFPRFYVTSPSPCPYVEGRTERKVFTVLTGERAQTLNESLTRVGFRRSQNVAYRPACEECNACMSVRVRAHDFVMGATWRRVLRANSMVTRTETPALVNDEQYDLIRRYLQGRHPNGGMTGMNAEDFAAMVEDSPVDTYLVEYRLPHPDPSLTKPGPLVGVCLTDSLSDGLSMVYSFYEPDMDKNSLGSFIILSHIQAAARAQLPYVYLGYWVADSRSMAYKTRFRPMEVLGPDGWGLLAP